MAIPGQRKPGGTGGGGMGGHRTSRYNSISRGGSPSKGGGGSGKKPGGGPCAVWAVGFILTVAAVGHLGYQALS